MRYFSCDSHVVEAREVFEGLEGRFGIVRPGSSTTGKGRPGDWLVLPEHVPIPVGRLGIAGNRLDDPRTTSDRPGLRGPEPGRARPPQAARRAGGRRHRGRGHVPVSLNMFTFAIARPRRGLGGVRAAQRLGARLLLGRARPPARHRLPAASPTSTTRWPRCSEPPRGACGASPSPPTSTRTGPTTTPTTTRSGPPPRTSGCPSPCTSSPARRSTAACPGTGARRAARSRATRWPTPPSVNTMIDLICGGVCERFPDLKFVISEFETGWVAHFLQRLDHAALPHAQVRRRLPHDEAVGLLPPQLRRDVRGRRGRHATRHLIGVDNMLWGNDYPHHDAIWPQLHEHARQDLRRRARRRARADVSSPTPSKLYDIDISKLPPE